MYDCIETMVGFRINWYWYACWMVTAPAFMLVSVFCESLAYFYNHLVVSVLSELLVMIFLIHFQFLFVFYFAKYTPITYAKTYEYPWWGEALGFCISGSSMIWVPGYAIYYLLTTKGTFLDRIKLGVTPTIKPRPDAVLAMEEAERKKLSNGEDTDVEMNLVSSSLHDNQNHL